MLPALETVLGYKNKAVLERYKKDFPTSVLSGEILFREMLKFMWLSLKARAERKNFLCVMHEEMLEIDNMWHTFLLFTRDYHTFCEEYLGEFFHHSPHVGQDKPPSDEEYASELTEYLTYINDNLGEETLKVWFKE